MNGPRTRRRAFSSPLAPTAVAVACTLGLLWWLAPASHAEAGVDLVSDTATALFTPDVPLVAGRLVDSCVVVAASGASAGDEIRVGAKDVVGALAPSLQVVVEVGTGGGGGSCTGFSR